MLGFATIDFEPNGRIVVWSSSRIPRNALDIGRTSIGHTNAVVVEPNDPDREAKVRSLLADRLVVTTSDNAPTVVVGSLLRVDDLVHLIQETQVAQRDLPASVRKSLPGVPIIPAPSDDRPAHTARTFATANYVVEVWAYWLATADKIRQRAKDKDERQKRPEDLPPNFAERFAPEPIR